MRLNCLQENLSHGLGVVQRAVATRTTLPITQHVLLTTDEGRLKLSATNLEIAISTWIGAEIQEEGAVTVPARLLTEFVNSLSRQALEVQALKHGKGITVKGDRVEANINGADANEFPPIPNVNSGIACQVAAKALRDGIRQVVFAAAIEDSRPVLTGVNLQFDGDQLTLAAADGFRLAVHTTTLARAVSEKLSVIVPARTMSEVERLIEGDDPIDVVVTPQRSQVLFRMKNVEMVSQLIQGTFPNYRQLVPQEHATRVVVGLGELQRAARTAAIFAKDGSGIIRLQMQPAGKGGGKLTISSRAEEVGEHVSELEAGVEGQDARIAFNSKYLTEVLNVIGEKQVSVELTTSSSPGVLRPVGNDRYVHVVMPMFVQW
ncbi:MAG: DNA polymerase III subunit beta [SAR202 cluster bacterium]|nr:DNA polymerase III subunit beta [SAR202 cluster bacterium]